MTKKKVSFIDKVYDSYIKTDYQYGDNNLNPKREIRKNSLLDTKDGLDKILTEIESKVNEIGKRYVDTKPLFKFASTNMNNDGKNPKGLSQQLQHAIYLAGGDTSNLVLIPSLENDDDPIPIEIGKIIPKIIGTLPPTWGPDNFHRDDNPTPANLDGLGIFKIDCTGQISMYDTKDSDESLKDSLNLDDTNKKGNGSSDNDNNDENSNNSGGGGGGSSSGGGNDTTDSGNDNAAAQQELATEKALQDMERAVAQNRADAAQCALADLKILEIILTVLKIIKVLKQIMDPILNIAVEVIQIVVLAAQAWNNPTTIGEIIQRIIQKLIAVACMVVAQLLQLIWDLLGLDCITSQAQNTISEIKATLAGIQGIFNEINATAVKFGNGIDKVQDAFDKASEEVKKALNKSLSDKLKETFDVSALSKDLYGGKTFQEAVGSEFKNAVEATEAYDKVMNTVESIKSLQNTFKNTAQVAMKAVGKDSEVSKFVARFSNVEAK